MNNILLIVIVVFLLLLLVLFYLTLRRHKKWSCTEKGCELVVNGKYNSKSDCEKSCEEGTDKQEDLDSDSEYNNWICTSNYNCVPSDQGWSNKQLCEQNCNRPQTTYYYYPQYYYPQSLMYSRRPYRWGPRFWSPRRRRRHGRGGHRGKKK